MKTSVELSITYVLYRQILTIPNRYLFRSFEGYWLVEVIEVGSNMVWSTRISKPSIIIALSDVEVGSICHCVQLSRWIFALVSKIHPMVAIYSIITNLSTDLTDWPGMFRLVEGVRILTIESRLWSLWTLWELVLWVLVLWLRVRITISATSSASFWIEIPSSASVVVGIAIVVLVCVRDKHSKCGVHIWAFIDG